MKTITYVERHYCLSSSPLQNKFHLSTHRERKVPPTESSSCFRPPPSSSYFPHFGCLLQWAGRRKKKSRDEGKKSESNKNTNKKTERNEKSVSVPSVRCINLLTSITKWQNFFLLRLHFFLPFSDASAAFSLTQLAERSGTYRMN